MGLQTGTPKGSKSDKDARHEAVLRQLAGFAPLVEHAPDPVVLLDRDGKVLYVNRTTAGVSPEHLLGRPFLGIVAEEGRNLVEAAIRHAVSPGLSQRLDMPLDDQGTTRWYLANVNPVRADGETTAVLVTTSEITTRKKEEARLRRSERLMVDTQGVAHLGTWEWDVTEPHAHWSPELYRIYGLDPKDHTPTYQDYLTRVHPDDRERVMKATEAVMQQQRPYSHDERIYHTDGSLRYLHTWAEPVLDKEGNVVRLLGVCLDITDAKLARLALEESEARFRAIFDDASIGICTLEPDGTVCETNPALQRILGEDAPALDGRMLETFLDPTDAETVLGRLRSLTEDHEADEPCLVRFVPPAADPFWAQLRLSFVHGTEGHDPFIVAFVEDVSVQRRLEEARRLADSRLLQIQELEKVSEAKSELISIASHEMKNPLTPIMVQLDILRRGNHGSLNEKQVRAVDTVHRQAQRLSHFVRDILDMARIEQGILAMRPRATELGTLVEHVASTYGPNADQRDVTLDTHSTPCEAVVDADRFEQILFNLIGNALNVTPKGGTIAVRSYPEGDDAVVEVTDSGPGLDAEQKEALFRPFTQVHHEGRAAAQGTGLGLYIVKNLVDAHGGAIEVESQPGAGATFRIRIPRNGPPEPDAAR